MNRRKALVQEETSIRTILIVILMVLILSSLIAYSIYLRNRRSQLESYLNEIDKIVRQSNRNLTSLNSYFSQFKGDPGSAAQVLPKFRDGQEELRKTVNKLKTLNPPPKATALHKELIGLFSKSPDLCGNLALVAKFIVKRNEILKELANDTEKLISATENARTDQELIDTAKDLGKSTDEGLVSLKSLNKPSILPYSNRAFETYMAELSQALHDLSKAIDSKGLVLLESAVTRIKSVFSQDWIKAQTEEDAKGLKKYKDAVKNLEITRKSTITEQNKLISELK